MTTISPFTGRDLPSHDPVFKDERHRRNVYERLGLDPATATVSDYWMANHVGRVNELRALGVW